LRRPFIFGLLCFSILLAAARTQAQHEGHPGQSATEWVPREVLERPVTLRQGIGTVHEAVTTASPQAQAFHDQGLAYLHSFVWIEAARSFRQALRLDPKLAMAHLGLSYAYSGLEDYWAARAAFENAQALAGNVSERERVRLDLRGLQLEAMADSSNLDKYVAYFKAIDAALRADPDNIQLWLLRGNAQEGTPFGYGQGGGPASIQSYEAALARAPDNFAAHHYLTHSLENIGRIEEALAHGEVYARSAPAIPHAHHMYGHDLRRVGRTEEAIEQFRKAEDLENTYYRAQNISPAYDWHHVHNLNLLANCYQYLGQMKAAEHLLREASSLPVYKDYLAINRKEWPEFLLGRGRAREALAAAQTMASGKWPAARIVGHALAGNALLAMKRTREAHAELDAADRELQALTSHGGQRVASVTLPYVEALRGEALLRTGKRAEGTAALEEVERKIRALPGPDAWSQALFRLESIARVARKAGEWELAEFTARQMLEHDPAYAGSHYALALAAEHKGDAATSREEFAAAEKLWSKADPDLPELARLRQKLTAQR
jgi:tetratricopeptide (TPR) repeat protein